MQCTDDKRTTNNVMRHEYRVLTVEEKAEMAALKDKGKDFYDYITITMIPRKGASRELSLALTKIEEAVMWATKHITA